MRRATFVAALLLGLVLIVSGIFPAQAQDDDQLFKVVQRLDALETDNANLRLQVEELEEMNAAFATMLAVNFAADCVVESTTFAILTETPMRSQAECMSVRVEFFDTLETEDRPFYQGVNAPIQEGISPGA